MARIKQKGKAGAAKAYVTRSSAIKKLQCSLADFRRLCILKGIFPREPRHRKRANKGSSAPTTFYYAKDIAYLAHEPVLQKLRDHKAFAKKLARALGRGEWSSAKSLEENKPVYGLDHIIKERYPTFIDALRDIDDALCVTYLFASLPSNSRIPPTLIKNCWRLGCEWQLYVMHSRSLRKVFLSIKGVYFQAEVMDQTITWLVPYQFTQTIPSDVDVRVMLTFLELYQTLLGFVHFKLYTDSGLVYPPPMDDEKDENGAGVGAFKLQDASTRPIAAPSAKQIVELNGKKISSQDVQDTIKDISAGSDDDTMETNLNEGNPPHGESEEDFVVQTSKLNPEENATLPTLQLLTTLPRAAAADLFSPYVFWLSRETPRALFEFMVRSFGGRIGWHASSGSGSPFDETHPSITHVIIDRPVVHRPNETELERERRRTRKYVQPQWIVDCINSGKILLEGPYEQGKTLPPHLSPFGEGKGAYVPDLVTNNDSAASEDGDAVSDPEPHEEEHVPEPQSEPTTSGTRFALSEVLADADDAEALRAAELQAEAAGIDVGTFEKEVVRTTRKGAKGKSSAEDDGEHNMNKMLMSRKQRNLYERMKYGEKKRAAERANIEEKRSQLKRPRPKS